MPRFKKYIKCDIGNYHVHS